jgi:hypothetical protein
MAAQMGAEEMGCPVSQVKVVAFSTRGTVPGGDVERYNAAMERYERGEEIVSTEE